MQVRAYLRTLNDLFLTGASGPMTPRYEPNGNFSSRPTTLENSENQPGFASALECLLMTSNAGCNTQPRNRGD